VPIRCYNARSVTVHGGGSEWIDKTEPLGMVTAKKTDWNRQVARTERARGNDSYIPDLSAQSPEEWPKWLRRFERFRQASGLKEKSEEAQGTL